MCAFLKTSVACGGQQTDSRQYCDTVDSDDEDRMQNRMRQYEKKIEMLLEQVAELEKEVHVISEQI